jgi:Tol biopolymer transport system component
MKKLIFFTLIAVLTTACMPQDGRIPQSPLLSTLERKSGLIAYIGVDGNLYVSDQAGGKKTQLTTDATDPLNPSAEVITYQLPTWSADGNQLAFMGMSGTSEDASGRILVANIESEAVNEIFSSKTEYPFFLLWSPDDSNISFLSTSASGQTLILQSTAAAGGGKSTIIDTGSPYYWSWAPNGRVLITHSGGAENSASPEHLAFIRFQDTDIIESSLDLTPAAFQAPAWSPDGSLIALTRAEDEKNEVILTDDTGKYLKTLGSFTLNTALGWSSDSKKVAFIDGVQTMQAGVIGELNVVDTETDEKVSAGENVIAFFWSPDAKRIAYFVPFLTTPEEGSAQSEEQLFLQLNMLDLETGESKELFTYRPTQQFATMLPYFDQYHQSNTIWSPDNNNLVLSFLDNEGNPGIAIVAASGQLEPRLLDEGFLAFWSWK